MCGYWVGDHQQASNHSLKENNGGIWGITKRDTKKCKEDLYAVFHLDKFSQFRSLIRVDSNNAKHIAYINDEKLQSILNTLVEPVDKVAIEIVSNTINSIHTHSFQYLKKLILYQQDLTHLFRKS